jgi:hypothetical protein
MNKYFTRKITKPHSAQTSSNADNSTSNFVPTKVTFFIFMNAKNWPLSILILSIPFPAAPIQY